MSRHRTTDPACRKHRAPRTPLGRWWFDRNRGRSCGVCVKPAAAWQCPECRDEMDVKFQRSHRRICATLTQIERMRYCVCPNCTRCGCGIWERHHANLSEITRVPARSDSGLPVDGEERK